MAPILFVSAALFSQNPDLVSLALNVIGNYATEFFRGERGEHEVRLDVVVEKKRNETYKKIRGIYLTPPTTRCCGFALLSLSHFLNPL